mgnify:FL=1
MSKTSQKGKKPARYSFINKSLIVFLSLLAISSALLILHIKGIIRVNPGVINIIRFFLSSAIVIVITNLLLRSSVDSVFRSFEKELDIEQRIFLTKVYTVFFYAIAASIILYIAGVGLSDLTLFLGLVATGVAFAVRDIISSFFIWLIVLTKRPFRIGDVITTDKDTGIVDRIGTFFITLKVKEGQESHLVRVPNKVLLDRNMLNHGPDRISGEVKLQMKNAPLDLEAFTRTLQDQLKTDDSDIFVSIDTNELVLQLSVRYATAYGKQKDIRLKILSTIYREYNSILKDAKEGDA